jgi:tetratricopeptide (TPR) repeat protein
MPAPALLEAQLHQALSLHQASRLAEAEALYRQVLAFRPDLAEVQVNCALTQLGQNKYGEAETSLQRAIAVRPNDAKAHLHMGDVLSFQNRMEEAVTSYRRAVRLKPDYAEGYNNLGNALLLLGEMEQARAAYRKAITLKPDFAQGHNNLGHIHFCLGHFEDALAEFTHAIAIAPGYAEAQNNLGNALHKLDRSREAQAAFRTAMRLAPGYADAYVNLSTCLLDIGKAAEAETAATDGVRLSPGAPQAHNALGNALREQGKLAEAATCYRKALTCNSDFAEAQKRLAETLCEDNRLADGFAVYADLAERTYGADAALPATADVAHKQRHDSEQQAWLGDKAATFYLADGNRIAGPAVNPAGRVAHLGEAGRIAQYQIAVIDDLLTAQALEKLRRFCMESTIWRQIYDDGYLGAFPEQGFVPQLLAQIAEELRSVHPAIIGDHPLLHFWAFKYDSSLRGTGTHADFAAVNVNFWITPDDANLDPDRGGLVIWDAAAPLDWDFAKYNAAGDDIRAFLEQEEAKPVIVPYRANRAVVFDSDLFHETDTIHFKPGYENRRINITLLFGRRETRRQ